MHHNVNNMCLWTAEYFYESGPDDPREPLTHPIWSWLVTNQVALRTYAYSLFDRMEKDREIIEGEGDCLVLRVAWELQESGKDGWDKLRWFKQLLRWRFMNEYEVLRKTNESKSERAQRKHNEYLKRTGRADQVRPIIPDEPNATDTLYWGKQPAKGWIWDPLVEDFDEDTGEVYATDYIDFDPTTNPDSYVGT